jgi:hypothetical protein
MEYHIYILLFIIIDIIGFLLTKITDSYYLWHFMNSSNKIFAWLQEKVYICSETTKLNSKMTEVLHNQQDVLLAAVSKWQILSDNLHYSWVVDYATYTAGGTFSLTESQWAERELVTNFKGNTELTTEIDHKEAVKKAIELIAHKIKKTFGDNASQLTLVCIPASTEETTCRRFEIFSEEVCKICGMDSGYSHILFQTDGSYIFDEGFFKSRPVLLMDDIIASGASVRRFAQNISESGAIVIAALALGKKVEDGYDQNA